MHTKTAILWSFGLVSIATAEICLPSKPVNMPPFQSPWGASSSTTPAVQSTWAGPHNDQPTSGSTTSSTSSSWYGPPGNKPTSSQNSWSGPPGNKPTSASSSTYPPTTMLTVTTTTSSLRGPETCIAKGADCSNQDGTLGCCGTLECYEKTLVCVDFGSGENPPPSLPSAPTTTTISPPSSTPTNPLSPVGTCIPEGASCAAQTEYYVCCGTLECFEDTLKCVDFGSGETPGSSSTTTILTPSPTATNPLSPSETCIPEGASCAAQTEDFFCCGLLECLESSLTCVDPGS